MSKVLRMIDFDNATFRISDYMNRFRIQDVNDKTVFNWVHTRNLQLNTQTI